MIKPNREYIIYFIFIPANHITAIPLNAISTDVPKSGWLKTNKIGTINIINGITNFLIELTASGWTLW